MIGQNPGLIGTSSAGQRIRAAGLAYQHAERRKRHSFVFGQALRTVWIASTSGDRGRCQQIIAGVAVAHGMSADALLGTNRLKAVTHARQHAYYRIAAETQLSLPQIGRVFKKDHTTILHGIFAHANRNGLPLPRPPKPGSQRDLESAA